MNQKYPSVLLENAVTEFAKLPGIGRKTALRLVLYLLRQNEEVALALSEALATLRKEVRYCRECYNICDSDLCSVCADSTREKNILCVVENVKEALAVENTAQFRGVYHVLGGVISPMEGISPSDLEIESLVERVKSGAIDEVILALSTTMEGDTTNFYIYKKLSGTGVKVSVIARGVSVGDELEYADEITLGRSILNRVAFDDTFKL